ncbi:transposable element Tcb1 transposase [Trichonephila clavipes]|nr:transposable element Tcb1 transposase [Trichonephila clavipes]
MWSMVTQRLTQITHPAAPPDQLWQRVEAAWSAVPQEYIQSLIESMPRCVAAVISNNGGYSVATDSGRIHTSLKSINLII